MQINFSSQPWQVFPSAKMRDFEKEDLTFSRRPEEDFILCMREQKMKCFQWKKECQGKL